MNEGTVQEAFHRMFPDESLGCAVEVKLSKKFSPYNANVRKAGGRLIFSFSDEWGSVSEEISIGLVQELLLRVMRRTAKETVNMGLYGSFVKNLHLSAQKTETDERLKALFEKVNAAYFNSLIELPNLKWGLNSRRRLATYDYHTDTIKVSSVFRDADDEVVSCLLHHEMLHKKLKFRSSSGRSIHHSRQFRELEKAFENRDAVERRLQAFARKRSGVFHGFIRKFL